MPGVSVYSRSARTLPGVVSVAGHVAGGLIKEMLVAYKAGRVVEAASLHQRLFPLFEVLFITSNPVPVKVALSLLGRPAGPVRQPLCEATPEEVERVAQVMREVGLLS